MNGINYKMRKLTAAELATLDGITSSTAELNKLDGAGAVVASGTRASHIANIATNASGTQISVAVNALIAAVEAFGVTATS